MSDAPDTPADRADAILRAAEATAAAATSERAREDAEPVTTRNGDRAEPAGPSADPAASAGGELGTTAAAPSSAVLSRHARLLELVDELGFQTAEARRRLDALDVALDRLAAGEGR